MKVRVHPGDEKAVGHYRIVWPALAARSAGVDVEIAQNLPILRATRRSDLREVITPDWEKIGDADVIVFQRVSNPEIVALIPALQAGGRAVVLDVDDDVLAVSRQNIAYAAEHPRMVARACALADVVTVSTPALVRRYGAHGRVRILENRVPEETLKLPNGRGLELTVGWGGWTATHPGDLRVTHGGVQDALDRVPGSRFLQVGPPDGVREQLNLREEPQATGAIRSLGGYHWALGRMHVGIAPLQSTVFNAAKSWLKPLEYLARGVPFVASPLPEYERLARESGAGLIAGERSRNWRQALVRLLTEESLREELVAQGRRHVAEHLTYERHGDLWADAWEAALHRRLSVSGKAAA